MPDVTAAPDPIDAIGVLAEPTRRAIYEYVAERDAAVGRDEAAAAIRIGRPLAAFHLDRLVAAGLLAAEFRRTNGRQGPGAGRPAKLYRRVRTEIGVSLPPRRYAWAAGILATSLEGADAPTLSAMADAARDEGREIAAAAQMSDAKPGARLRSLLARQGFEPRDDPARPGIVRLMNCPFESVARTHTAVVCAMNLALVEGMVEAFPGAAAEPDAGPSGCCVAVREAGA